MPILNFETLLLPPDSLIVLFALAWLAQLHWPRVGRAIGGLALLALYVLSTPLVSQSLLRSFEPAKPLDLKRDVAGAQAIVVLSADWHDRAPEYGGLTVVALTLDRLRYAAKLHRLTGLPILVSGGQRQ